MTRRPTRRVRAWCALVCAVFLTTVMPAVSAGAQTVEETESTDPGADAASAFDLGDVTASGPLGTGAGGPWEHSLDATDSIDYFQFELTADRRVGIGLSFMDANADLFLEDTGGNVLASSETRGNKSELLNDELTAGIYYVRVEAQGNRRNTYQMFIATAIDHIRDPSSDAGTGVTVAVDGCYEASDGARIAPSWDIDWVGVDLVAGMTYVLEVRGRHSGAGTLGDPELMGVFADASIADAYAAAGRLGDKQRITDNGLGGLAYDLDDGNVSDAWLTFYAEATGRHFIEVRASGWLEGSYTVAVALEADAPSSCATPPQIIDNLNAEPVNDTTVVLEWVEPEENGAPILGYDVEYRESVGGLVVDDQVGGGDPPVFSDFNISDDAEDGWQRWPRHGDPLETTEVIDGLKPNAQYEFRVRAINDRGTAEWSDDDITDEDPDPVVVQTLAPGQGNQAPELVSPTSPVIAIENVPLAVPLIVIDDNAEDPVGAVELLSGTPAGVFSVNGSDELVAAAGTLDYEAGSYEVLLRLSSGIGDRALSVERTLEIAVGDVDEPPTALTNVAVTSFSADWATLEWDPASTTGPQDISYEVRYRESTSISAWTLDATVTSLSHTVTGLSPETAYEFAVRAVNDEGSSLDEVVSLTTPVASTLLVSPASVTVDESGTNSTATFELQLSTAPAANVTVTFASDDPAAVSVPGTALTFTTGDWNFPQSVTVTGVDDADASNQFTSVTATASSSDADYDGETASVSVTVIDTDVPGLVVGPSSVAADGLEVDEDDSGSFTVKLATQPTAPVTVTVVSGDADAAKVDVGGTPAASAVLTFTTGNWNSTQSVTVSGVADPDTADESLSVVLAAASTDSGYAGKSGSVSVSVVDDDEAGLVVGPMSVADSGLTVGEADSGTFTVALATQPTAPVTVTVSSTNCAPMRTSSAACWTASETGTRNETARSQR